MCPIPKNNTIYEGPPKMRTPLRPNQEDIFYKLQELDMNSDHVYKEREGAGYSDRESFKKLQEVAKWHKFSIIGYYSHMGITYNIDSLVFDVPHIPDYWITARLSPAHKNHTNI
ncbi:hypothetical protein O181_041417 [Austropuccinia psidii MF-1]|uniref:Uncharacterized protein n=1 Tax=Austropuccinia psidii MF-1 TaxID=1389203 RepID=A0A9Q3HEU3_9BASI|nr:hypothetical protein [Austropuccinia psidii MF-1]